MKDHATPIIVLTVIFLLVFSPDMASVFPRAPRVQAQTGSQWTGTYQASYTGEDVSGTDSNGQPVGDAITASDVGQFSFTVCDSGPPCLTGHGQGTARISETPLPGGGCSGSASTSYTFDIMVLSTYAGTSLW